MRKSLIAGAMVFVAACSQPSGEDSEQDRGDAARISGNQNVCQELDRRVDFNLRARMFRKIREGGWDDVAIGNAVDSRFDTQMILLFQLMEHHGCALPTEPPSDLIYNAEGAECVAAIGTPNEDDECFPDDWIANKGMTTPTDAEASADSEGE